MGIRALLPQQAQWSLCERIGICYNQPRRRSTLGYPSPSDFEAASLVA